jgi:pimeloyl-ACP methyl ester carboxylesterase
VTGLNCTIITHEPEAAPRDAPPLLFVHGAYVGGWCWAENFLPYFAALGYRAHAIDLCRHNRGRLRLTPYASLSDYIEEIEASIASLGESPVLIGHSMGGYLVQQYIARQSAPAAVLMASVPPQGLLPTTAWLALTNPLLFQQIQLLQWLGPQTVFALYGVEGGRRPLFSPHLADEKVREYVSRAQLESPQAIMEMSLPLVAQPQTASAVKTLVMGAGLDRLIPASAIHSTAIARGTQAVFVDELGHAMMLDHHWLHAATIVENWLLEQGM